MRRQPHRPLKLQPLVAQQLIWQVRPQLQLPLVRGALRAQPKHVRDAVLAQLGQAVAEGAGLRGAAARAGDGVPGGRDGLAGGAGARVEEEDGEAGEGGEVDGLGGVAGGGEGRGGDGVAGEVGAGAVVGGNGEGGR